MKQVFTLVAVDPGAQGAVVVETEGGFKAHRMPATSHGIARLFHALALTVPPILVLAEDVGDARPGNQSSSVVTFARHVGLLEGIWAAYQISVLWVPPITWMTGVSKGAHPKGGDPEAKKARKAWFVSYVRDRWDPSLRSYMGDAVGIFTWGYDNRGQVQAMHERVLKAHEP